MLRRKVKQLKDAGLWAELLSSDDLQTEEPALDLGQECGAAFMPDDCQLDARHAVAFIEKVAIHLSSLKRLWYLKSYSKKNCATFI